jgi:hypothetical protein
METEIPKYVYIKTVISTTNFFVAEICYWSSEKAPDFGV